MPSIESAASKICPIKLANSNPEIFDNYSLTMNTGYGYFCYSCDCMAWVMPEFVSKEALLCRALKNECNDPIRLGNKQEFDLQRCRESCGEVLTCPVWADVQGYCALFQAK